MSDAAPVTFVGGPFDGQQREYQPPRPPIYVVELLVGVTREDGKKKYMAYRYERVGESNAYSYVGSSENWWFA